MAWTVRFNEQALEELADLDRQVQDRITRYLSERVAPMDNPRFVGKPLTGPWKKYWSYRVGDYRVLAEFNDDVLVILVVRVGHRREVYER